MDNITELPNRAVIRREAEAWIIRLDGLDTPSPEELGALREWLSRSPVHRQELSSANAFWANNSLTELVVPLDRRESGGWHGWIQHIFRKRGRWCPAKTTAIGVAASLVVIAIALLAYYFPGDDSTNGLYVTAVGQQSQVVLADGSTVQLNTNSQIQVEFDNEYRNIRLLQGEAHFSVAKNPQKPFRVYAVNNRVQAVGTAFTVYLKQKDLNVLVTEGRVSVAALSSLQEEAKTQKEQSLAQLAVPVDQYARSLSRELAMLEAHQSITIGESSGYPGEPVDVLDKVEQVSDQELARRESWRSGSLMFNGETLEQAVNEIGRYTTLSIEIPDPNVRAIQVGGRFQVGDIDALLSALEANFNLKVNYLGYNRVELSATL
jgi:transmembrane sensor